DDRQRRLSAWLSAVRPAHRGRNRLLSPDGDRRRRRLLLNARLGWQARITASDDGHVGNRGGHTEWRVPRRLLRSEWNGLDLWQRRQGCKPAAPGITELGRAHRRAGHTF